MKELFARDTWQEIFGSISKNRLRTVITMIGVLWGCRSYRNGGTAKSDVAHLAVLAAEYTSTKMWTPWRARSRRAHTAKVLGLRPAGGGGQRWGEGGTA